MTCHYIIVSIFIISESYSLLLVIRCNGITIVSKERLRSLKEAVFRKTWSLADGSATTVAPIKSRKRSLLWTGKIPTDFLDEQLLVRNVGLSSQGKLDDTTVNLAARLKIPHQVGA